MRGYEGKPLESSVLHLDRASREIVQKRWTRKENLAAYRAQSSNLHVHPVFSAAPLIREQPVTSVSQIERVNDFHMLKCSTRHLPRRDGNLLVLQLKHSRTVFSATRREKPDESVFSFTRSPPPTERHHCVLRLFSSSSSYAVWSDVRVRVFIFTTGLLLPAQQSVPVTGELCTIHLRYDMI